MADVKRLVPHILKWEELPEVNSDRWLSLEDLQGEVWKDVPDYECVYMVSNYGRLKSLKRDGAACDRIVKVFLYPDKRYYHVRLRNRGIKHTSLHRIVAGAFHKKDDDKKCVDHINGNTHDNRAENLRWVTSLENSNNPITVKRKTIWGLSMRNNKRSKAVVQLNNEGIEIAKYDSIGEAQRMTGISKTSISRAIRGYTHINAKGIKRSVKSAGGYNWKFV